MIVYAKQGETIDEIAYRIFGRTTGIVEMILNNNPKLCDLPAKLPNGTQIVINETVPQATKTQIKLWD